MRPEPARQIRICLFDIMGTVVDIEGTVKQETTDGLRAVGLSRDDIDAVLARHEARLGELMRDVTAGVRPWQRHRQLRLIALRETLQELSLAPLAPDLEQHLSMVVHRLEPWPDSAAALRRLEQLVTVVGLSNADLAELAGLTRHGDLSWHALLSGELVQAFKPDPAVYRMALRLLDVPAAEVLMVAAHPWDLRAAADQGMATAYVARPGAESPGPADTFDHTVPDLASLVSLFAPEGD